MGSGCSLVPIVLRVFKSSFSDNNKKLFPLFFLVFREQKNPKKKKKQNKKRKKNISLCFQSGVLHVFPVIFPPIRLQPPACLQQVSLPTQYQGAIHSVFLSNPSYQRKSKVRFTRYSQPSLHSHLIYHEICIGLLVFMHVSSWLLWLVVEKFWIFFLGIVRFRVLFIYLFIISFSP